MLRGADASLPPSSSRGSEEHPSNFLPAYVVVFLAATVGAAAAFVANPFDVALIRMQADGHFHPSQRRNYAHVFDAVHSIVRNEGVHTLWRGCGPTVTRAALCTLTQLPTYIYTKQALISLGYFGKDDSTLHILSSLASASAASIATAPVDVIKTRIINMNDNRYSGTVDCIVKIIRYEGVRGLYKGLVPTFVRLTPHTLVLWTVQEACLRHLWRVSS